MTNELREKLGTKGAKCNLQFPAAERDYYLSECGFTDEERDIFILRSRGKTILQISFIMEEKYKKELTNNEYSIFKVEQRIRSIKKKILAVSKEYSKV